MKALATFMCCLLLIGHSTAQSNSVNVYFELDGKQTKFDSATVKFINKGDTIITSIEDGALNIPSEVFNKRVTAVFYIDNYSLKFDSIPITLNGLSPKWTLGVDKKPFDKERFRTIKLWRKVEIVYYWHNDDGRTFTVDRCKKSVVMLKP